jgi:hypothetical protein
LTQILDKQTKEEYGIILIIDGNNKVWELIERKDLDNNTIMETDKIESILNYNIDAYKLIGNEEIINVNNNTYLSSDVDISRISEFNISNLIKETNNDISGIY